MAYEVECDDSVSVVVPRQSAFAEDSQRQLLQQRQKQEGSRIEEEQEPESDDEDLQDKESAFIFNGSELRTQFDQRNIRNAKVAAVGTCGYFSVLKKDRKTGTISVPPEAFNVSGSRPHVTTLYDRWYR